MDVVGSAGALGREGEGGGGGGRARAVPCQ